MIRIGDTPTLTAPPMPTWHGYGLGLVEKYTSFVQARMQQIVAREPDRLADLLASRSNMLAIYQSDLERFRAKIASQEAEIAKITRVIDRGLSNEEITEELARMCALDWVIGTRTDMQGRLYVQIRVLAERGDRMYDVGDYEIGFVRHGTGKYVVHMIRFPWSIDFDSHISGWNRTDTYNDVRVGYMSVSGYHLHTGQLVELVTQIYERLQSSVANLNEYGCRCRFQEDTGAEQVWDGFIPNPLKAFKRSIKLLQDSTLDAVRRELKTHLRETEDEVDQLIRRIREQQVKIRHTRAQHAKAVQAATNGVSVNERQLARDIEHIARLPGVMGIRFDEDGVPVIHIRTTWARDGRRYDLGDVELSLTTLGRNDSRSVVKIRSTRLDFGRNMYLHEPDTGATWFCFGNRTSELQQLFDRADYVQFVHLAINTMNAINSGAERSVHEYYTRIPLDAVWRKKRKPIRPRRRRRPLEDVLSEGEAG